VPIEINIQRMCTEENTMHSSMQCWSAQEEKLCRMNTRRRLQRKTEPDKDKSGRFAIFLLDRVALNEVN